MSSFPVTNARLAALRTRMAETGTDLVALGPSSHMAWLSGVHPHGDERPVMLLVAQDYAGFLMPALNAAAARKDTDLPFHPWSDDQGPEAALRALLEACGVTAPNLSVVLDETMRTDFALRLLDALDSPRRRFTEDTVGLLRAAKDDSEYRALKAAHLANDKAVKAAFAALEEGVTEAEIVELIKSEYAAMGAALEFCSVCFGESGAFPHHTPGAAPLKRDMAVLIDTGCRLDGYPSDMTRCGYFGQPEDGYAEVFSVVEQAVQAALAAAKPGVRACDIDKAARDVITAAGYGDRFLHRTGHGLGVDIHEPPYIAANSDVVLKEGNVFSIEPGIYLDGKFGIRLEEIVILREDGAEIFSEMPRDMVHVG
ncbi:Xaa-Pro peptidase family protein [Celeribacter sp. PS-C1]|uniref:M24 family metallopeptidase n=1 Tax=Celeribacter sp. PS-C1 TaxID=2820813 RepID=UPI001C67AC4F|nr:Xaa-Pro peptidase family protein [Celeribacter sp. PS-C1]MBW6419012.1 Xaa-Pro peptidase family protein [Celeribacter sp. PS-C1]